MKVINLGKIDYFGMGKADCSVDVEIELRDLDKGKELSICGTIWNPEHTDCYAGGQCLDTINKYVKTPEFKEIYRLWKSYHLNGMHAGTPKQEEALRKVGKTAFATAYVDCCNYLDSIGLLVDDGYKFGTDWLYQPIPQEDLEKINNLLK